MPTAEVPVARGILDTAQDVLVIAVLAQFMVENGVLFDERTFVVGTVGLALGVGLGGRALVDPGLSVLALGVAAWRMAAQHPELTTVYAALAAVLIVVYLFGRYVGWTVWRIPALIALLVVGAAWLTGTVRL